MTTVSHDVVGRPLAVGFGALVSVAGSMAVVMMGLAARVRLAHRVTQVSGHGLAGAVVPALLVLEVKGLHWASEKAVIEIALGRLDGVRTVEANPVAQTATVSYDPATTDVGQFGAGSYVPSRQKMVPAAPWPTSPTRPECDGGGLRPCPFSARE